MDKLYHWRPAIAGALMVLYLLVNSYFISMCVAGSGGPGCSVLFSFVSPVFDFVPAIRKPVEFLVSQNEEARARLVQQAYSFAWMTGVIYCGFILPAFLALEAAAGRDAKIEENKLYEKVEAEYGKNAPAIPTMILIIMWGYGLYSIIWGDHDDYTQFLSSKNNWLDLLDFEFYLMSIDWLTTMFPSAYLLVEFFRQKFVDRSRSAI